MGREAGLERSPGDSASAAIAKPARPQGEQVEIRASFGTARCRVASARPLAYDLSHATIRISSLLGACGDRRVSHDSSGAPGSGVAVSKSPDRALVSQFRRVCCNLGVRVYLRTHRPITPGQGILDAGSVCRHRPSTADVASHGDDLPQSTTVPAVAVDYRSRTGLDGFPCMDCTLTQLVLGGADSYGANGSCRENQLRLPVVVLLCSRSLRIPATGGYRACHRLRDDAHESGVPQATGTPPPRNGDPSHL
jgi:hypothetical protein